VQVVRAVPRTWSVIKVTRRLMATICIVLCRIIFRPQRLLQYEGYCRVVQQARPRQPSRVRKVEATSPMRFDLNAFGSHERTTTVYLFFCTRPAAPSVREHECQQVVRLAFFQALDIFAFLGCVQPGSAWTGKFQFGNLFRDALLRNVETRYVSWKSDLSFPRFLIFKRARNRRFLRFTPVWI